MRRDFGRRITKPRQGCGRVVHSGVMQHDYAGAQPLAPRPEIW